MGGHLVWGSMGRLKGVVTYAISPMEQRAFAGLISKGLPNVFRRVTENIPDVAPAFIFYYAVYSWASNSHANMHRKQPGATGAH